jgi:penicillin-binding protein 1A
MVDMLHSVVESGTGRRARLPGIHVAGKTGTTNAYRDAWFVGFTGNYTTAVWLGNDNYEPTNRLTGGILPAETWAKYMRAAMAFVEPKLLPGLPPPEPSADQLLASAEDGAALINPGGSGWLSPDTSNALGRIEELFSKASGEAPLRQAALTGTAAEP